MHAIVLDCVTFGGQVQAIPSIAIGVFIFCMNDVASGIGETSRLAKTPLEVQVIEQDRVPVTEG